MFQGFPWSLIFRVPIACLIKPRPLPALEVCLLYTSWGPWGLLWNIPYAFLHLVHFMEPPSLSVGLSPELTFPDNSTFILSFQSLSVFLSVGSHNSSPIMCSLAIIWSQTSSGWSKTYILPYSNSKGLYSLIEVEFCFLFVSNIGLNKGQCLELGNNLIHSQSRH